MLMKQDVYDIQYISEQLEGITVVLGQEVKH